MMSKSSAGKGDGNRVANHKQYRACPLWDKNCSGRTSTADTLTLDELKTLEAKQETPPKSVYQQPMIPTSDL